jgi:hypothetical protein
MQCTSCKMVLPPGVGICPQCGMATPYNIQNTSQAQLPPTQQVLKTHRGITAGMAALLTMLVLLMLGGSGFTYYVAVLRPQEFHEQATSVANNFLTAQVRATTLANAEATPHALATATALQNMYTQATSGQLLLNDPLNENNSNVWDIVNTPRAGCQFAGGAYHAQASAVNSFAPCLAQIGNLSNFAFQVQTTLIKGDYGGLTFRFSGITSNSMQAYFFTTDFTGGYMLFTMPNDRLNILTRGYNRAIKANLDQPNLLTVVARGSNIYLYVNHEYVGSISDNSYTSGEIGVFAYAFFDPTDVAFSNAQVWNLP